MAATLRAFVVSRPCPQNTHDVDIQEAGLFCFTLSADRYFGLLKCRKRWQVIQQLRIFRKHLQGLIFLLNHHHQVQTSSPLNTGLHRVVFFFTTQGCEKDARPREIQPLTFFFFFQAVIKDTNTAGSDTNNITSVENGMLPRAQIHTLGSQELF